MTAWFIAHANPLQETQATIHVIRQPVAKCAKNNIAKFAIVVKGIVHFAAKAVNLWSKQQPTINVDNLRDKRQMLTMWRNKKKNDVSGRTQENDLVNMCEFFDMKLADEETMMSCGTR